MLRCKSSLTVPGESLSVPGETWQESFTLPVKPISITDRTGDLTIPPVSVHLENTKQPPKCLVEVSTSCPFRQKASALPTKLSGEGLGGSRKQRKRGFRERDKKRLEMIREDAGGEYGGCVYALRCITSSSDYGGSYIDSDHDFIS